jgi:UDP-glucose 4-epimerase
MSILITGGAGFIGVNLAKRFVTENKRVYLLDNLCRGSLKNIYRLSLQGAVEVIQVDLHNYNKSLSAISQIDRNEEITEVWHLAANSDIPAGTNDSEIDLRDTFMTTYNIIRIMRILDIKFFAFASTSAVYGDRGNESLVETLGPLLPISNYGAMKLASEAFISAAVESFLDTALIFRFPNVIGMPGTHGVIYDFIGKLKESRSYLEVLGDGTQQKSYLHVSDLIDAMLHVRDLNYSGVNVFNVGPNDEGITVKGIAEEVVRQLCPDARIVYGNGNKGWVGDVPKFRYNNDKLRATGWSPSMSSEEAVRLAVGELLRTS